ncbi:hypothetical protein KBY82_01065 [Cyanobium sp. AMD-g]|uniref:hypothetical protein n=1 Tax=Cyanobium sp. AMD-g TaxID=2823699 RepID=UPI0020CF5214|nr:hypothetical protein [Cyanobium sp. AMD-g]MCP9929367.1 hypothetical protein [Cyanobium sp. AMD-g]
MEFQPITTALSRALALRLDPGTTYLGSGLNLEISPSAQASNQVVLPAAQSIGSIATALGLGLGASRFLAGPENGDFFNSPGLSVVTGGGSIGGNAAATAQTRGRNDNSADATAVNIGLANLDVVTRGGGVLSIGTAADPFTASAKAASRSLLAPQANPFLTAQLSALATVRGLEGLPPVAPAPSAPSLAIAGLPTFYGQPNAAVLAAATLDLDPGPTTTTARAVADAKGIEGYRVMALSPGTGSAALVSGMATASLGLAGAPPTTAQPADLTATAIGIDQAALRGPGNGAVLFKGAGLALLNAPAALPPGSLNLQSLQGIGIAVSDIQSNGGDAWVVGEGGFAAPKSGGLVPSMDAAGIDRSRIYTGSGNDVVIGRIFTEQNAGVDANGDGVLSPNVFLDASALIGGPGGFDGIRNSTINTGLGDDLVGISNKGELALPAPGSSASNSQIDTSIGNDQIKLYNARTSSLDGGFGNDVVMVTNLALDNSLKGGFGNDRVEVAAGDGNRLDGGFGQDLTIGGTGKNTFLQSNAGAALDAASRDTAPGTTSTFAERLTDPNFWEGLGAETKQYLWNKGKLAPDEPVIADTFKNFDAARGDVLELSSSLGSLTQNLWDSQGALFGVQDGQLKVLEGPANSQLGLVVGTLNDIHSLGIGSPSLAYATDTRQLMFDADGDWKDGGSRSLGTVNMTDPASLTKANIHFGSGA